MNTSDTVVAVFADHNGAETAIKKLTDDGFKMKNLSVIGKGLRWMALAGQESDGLKVESRRLSFPGYAASRSIS